MSVRSENVTKAGSSVVVCAVCGTFLVVFGPTAGAAQNQSPTVSGNASSDPWSKAIPFLSGGLAGAVLTLALTPWVQRSVQKSVIRLTGKKDAIRDVVDWTSKAYTLYMGNEAKWAAGVRPQDATATLFSPEYQLSRTLADVMVKTNFSADRYTEFKSFADWLEKALHLAYAQGESFPFEEFHRGVEGVISSLAKAI
jgi:hypothetical protein